MEMKMMRRLLAGAGALLSQRVRGCDGRRTTRARKPVLDLKEYFNGRVDAWGIVQEPLRADHQANDGRDDLHLERGRGHAFDERFTYADGTKETRVWTIRKEGNRYTGTAAGRRGRGEGRGGRKRAALELRSSRRSARTAVPSTST